MQWAGKAYTTEEEKAAKEAKEQYAAA